MARNVPDLALFLDVIQGEKNWGRPMPQVSSFLDVATNPEKHISGKPFAWTPTLNSPVITSGNELMV